MSSVACSHKPQSWPVTLLWEQGVHEPHQGTCRDIWVKEDNADIIIGFHGKEASKLQPKRGKSSMLYTSKLQSHVAVADQG